MILSSVHLPNKLFEMKIPSLLWTLVPFLFACANSPQTKPDQPATEAPKQLEDGPRIYLEGAYATSTAPGASLQSLFDNNPATTWHTRPGTGPDEGIMLYFQNPVSLATVEVMAEQGSFSDEKGAVLEIVGNGTIIGAGIHNTKINVDTKPVKSLFIHIQSTGKEVQSKQGDVNIATYPRNLSVGLSDIILRDDKGAVVPIALPQVLNGVVTATSTLQPESAYSTANLFDGRKEFCWVEGNANSAGENEVLKFSFADPNVNITALQIWNGYQRSDEHFSANARVRDFELSSAGNPVKTYTLRDTKAGQRIELATPFKGNELTLRIKSVYPGKRYKDLAISDLVFFDGEKPMVIRTGFSEKMQADMQAKSATSPLSGLLDRRITNDTKLDGTMPLTQSLILRSDGTFVLYTRSSDTEDESNAGVQKTFADGNWELQRADGKSATVKIFGQWTDVSNLADYYKGSTTEQVTRIFNDVLTIEKNKLHGTKMLGEFVY